LGNRKHPASIDGSITVREIRGELENVMVRRYTCVFGLFPDFGF
jgi:hypothetical protein